MRLLLGLFDHAGLESETKILGQGRLQIAAALRLKQEIERAHFRSIVGAGGNAGVTAQAELRERRLSEIERCELRRHAGDNSVACGRTGSALQREIRLAIESRG